jgi:hypothetical protein
MTPTGSHCCDEMTRHLSEGDVAIRFAPRFREYGIMVLDGGDSLQAVIWCPWCGSRLPPSLRDHWFDMLDALGLEPGDSGVPIDMRSDAWWRMRGL